jgi:hypothetical protein
MPLFAMLYFATIIDCFEKFHRQIVTIGNRRRKQSAPNKLH